MRLLAGCKCVRYAPNGRGSTAVWE